MNYVLVIDGNLFICKEIKYNLQDSTTEVYYTQSVEEAVKMMRQKNFTLVILDVCISPDRGMALIEQIRQMYPLPILVLSETASTADKVEALKMGADDFLHKPYDLEECLARAQALMRRYTHLNHISIENGYAILNYGDLLLDTVRRQVFVDKEKVLLTRKEYELLLYFIKNRNRILTYEQIYKAVWRGRIPFQ